MATDRSADRHEPGSRHQITLPADLWRRLGDAVGDGNRSLQIRELVEAFLDQKPMPPLPRRLVEPQQPAKRTGRIRPIARPDIPPKRP